MQFKYQTITQQLSDMMTKMENGDRFPNKLTLLKQLNVSQSTLDSALLHLEKQNKITRKRGSGIFVKKRVTAGKVALFLPDYDTEYCIQLYQALQKGLKSIGIDYISLNSKLTLSEELKGIQNINLKLDAIIILPFTKDALNPKYIEKLKRISSKQAVPLLCLNIPIIGIESYFIGFNEYDTFETIVNQYKTHIKKHPNLFLSVIDSYISIQRIQGFKSGLTQSGISYNKIQFLDATIENYTEQKLKEILVRKFDYGMNIFCTIPDLNPLLIKLLKEEQRFIRKKIKLFLVSEEKDNLDNGMPIVYLQKNTTLLANTAIEILQNLLDNKAPELSHIIPINITASN